MESRYYIAEGALKRVPEFYRSQWGDRQPLLIADRNTLEAAGSRLLEYFNSDGYSASLFVFEDEEDVYADDTHVQIIENLFLTHEGVPIAVGSGTINDVVKLASHRSGRTYMSVATAPSVDGYTAFGAAITIDGFKQTVFCPAPVWVVADSDVLAHCPYPMIASGYGDMAAKVTAGADWMIADALKVEPIVSHLWAMVQHPLRDQLAHPEQLALRNKVVIEKLCNGLVQVGNAMQAYHDSRPASGAEHLMSHVWEMDHLMVGNAHVSHGFKVGFATLAMTAFMEELVSYDAQALTRIINEKPKDDWHVRHAMILGHVGASPLIDAIVAASRKKFLENDALAARREHIIAVWDTLSRRIKDQLIPFATLKRQLADAGCPTEPEDINLDIHRLRRGMYVAQMIRTRYTVLDLAYECNLLDILIEKVLHSKTYFSRFSAH